MAGKVKKGFGTYMFILLLTLIAAFLIMVMVMIFNPFKNVMGYQYLFYQDEYSETNVTGGGTGTIFDLSAMEEIKINCNYANVEVVRSNDVETNVIKIENKMNGFAKADEDVEFAYEIYYEKGSNDKILCVDIEEAEGFLFFSRNVRVSILLPENADVNLSNVKLNITNDSGTISIGYGNSTAPAISVGELNLKAKSGAIRLGYLLNPQVEDIFISTESGGISTDVDLEATNSFSLNAQRGKLEFKNIKLASAKTATMILGNSEFFANQITGNVDLEIDDGYFDLVKLAGDISGNDAAEQMTTSTINIGEVDGNVSFPFANEARININKINNGKLYVHGTTGHVNVGELNGYGWIEMTSGNVEVGLNSACDIKTTSGQIKVLYKQNALTEKISLTSESGDVYLGVNAALAFVLNVYNAQGQARTSENISVEGFDAGFTLPLEVNRGRTPIDITTNSRVEISINK